MDFMDKLGQMASKVGEVAGDTLDYGKAKGKILFERGKVKEGKEALGEYVYNAMKADGNVELSRVNALVAEIDSHVIEIERLEAEAKQSGEEIGDAFKGE